MYLPILLIFISESVSVASLSKKSDENEIILKVNELKIIVEKQKQQIESDLKKIGTHETENNNLKFDQINEKKIVELKYREFNNEIENLTKSIENASSKSRRIEQQLLKS